MNRINRRTRLTRYPLLIVLALLALLGLLVAKAAKAAEDYLPPEQAFQLTGRMVDAQTLELSYRIADGYYMYRDRFHFSAEGATLGGGFGWASRNSRRVNASMTKTSRRKLKPTISR